MKTIVKRLIRKNKVHLKVLSLFLVVLLIFIGCFGSTLTVHAVVPLAVTVVAGLLTAAGVAFTTYAAAEHISNLVLMKLEYELEAPENQAGLLLIDFASSYWQKVFTDVVNSFCELFGDKEDILNFHTIEMGDSTPYDLITDSDGFTIELDTPFTANSDITVDMGSARFRFMGFHIAASEIPNFSGTNEDRIYIEMSFPVLNSTIYSILHSSVNPNTSSLRLWYRPDYSPPCFCFSPNFMSSDFSKFSSTNNYSHVLFYNGTCYRNDSDDSKTYFNLLDSSGVNLVNNSLGYNAYGSTSIAIPESVYVNGSFTSFANFMTWTLGADIPSVNVDQDYYCDQWVEDVKSGTISSDASTSISIPATLTDVIGLTASDIRDVSGDISGSGSGSSSNTKPMLPDLSLPEILFKEKFPFCLPWDIYNVFAILVAEPKAPVFEIPFKYERLGIDYSFTIDLSIFEDIAATSRFFTSLSFIIFLILISRRMIGAE